MEFAGPYNQSGLFNGHASRLQHMVVVGGQMQVVDDNPPPNHSPTKGSVNFNLPGID